jgi:DNA (cytosine-5)-methyltransferase 1
MRYLSVCSGIEAASVAWHPLGWEPLAFSEIEAFPRAVLAHHYPGVPLHGDFTVLREQPWIVDADVLVGGTPCQAFSVAGLRNSLADDRGNLSLEFVRLADAIDDVRHDAGRDPAIIVWENVPGVLSVKDNAFGCFLAGLAGEDTPLIPTGGKWTDFGVVIGPRRRITWRVLDAQYFGLAQRRRRVFVVASARDWFDPVQVLSQPNGVQRHIAPSRKAGKIAPTIPSRSTAGGGLGTDFDLDGGVIQHTEDLADTLSVGANQTTGFSSPSIVASTGDMGRQDYETETLVSVAVLLQEVGKRTGVSTDDPRAGIGIGQDGDPMFTLQAGARHGVAANMAVRRLTPLECSRLQGFPDDYLTQVTWRGKCPPPDGPMYKALGNSMAVPCMAWIGQRIAAEIARASTQSEEIAA